MFRCFIEKAFARVCGLKDPVLDFVLRNVLESRGIVFFARDDGRRLEDDFDVPNDGGLGSGNYAVVRLAQHRASGEKFASKCLKTVVHVDGSGNLVGADWHRLRHEIEALSAVRGHPGMLLLHAVYEGVCAVNLVTELCAGGNLLQLLLPRRPHGLDEQIVCQILQQLIDALVHVHAAPHHLAHCDVKLENLMLVQQQCDDVLPPGGLKVVDFGSCASFAADPAENACLFTVFAGTRFYASPEKMALRYGAKADIWAAGAVLYVLLAGVPADGRADQGAAELMRRGALSDLLQRPNRSFSGDVIEALGALLSVEMVQRPTAARAQAQLALLQAGGPRAALDPCVEPRLEVT